MKEGPTVYKLVKPILKVIKEARAKECVAVDFEYHLSSADTDLIVGAAERSQVSSWSCRIGSYSRIIIKQSNTLSL